jgi:hypothetical protein
VTKSDARVTIAIDPHKARVTIAIDPHKASWTAAAVDQHRAANSRG